MGSYGEVRLGTNKKTGIKAAIKKIPIDPSDRDLLNMICNEINILISCDHPNIIRIYDAYRESKVTYIVEEYIPNCKELT